MQDSMDPLSEGALSDSNARIGRAAVLPHAALSTRDLEQEFDHEESQEPGVGDEQRARSQGSTRTQTELDSAPQHAVADDAVHFDVAARALSVSRKTVERMVKRGELTRDTSGSGAAVTKRSLVGELERRRKGPVDLITEPPATNGASDSRQLLAPLLDEVVDARVNAELYKRQLTLLEEQANKRGYRDELLAVLVAGSRRERRRARRVAMAELLKHRDE